MRFDFTDLISNIQRALWNVLPYINTVFFCSDIPNQKVNYQIIIHRSFFVISWQQLKIFVIDYIDPLSRNLNSKPRLFLSIKVHSAWCEIKYDILWFFSITTKFHSVWCRINYDIFSKFSALVWGSSVKHNPQKVGKEHKLNDEDVVQIVKR